jgi:hypothetical protein
MNMIRLEGLTPLQADLADHIWQLDTQEQVAEWLGGLPRSLRDQAVSLLYLITVECIDQDPITDLSEALAVIRSVQ